MCREERLNILALIIKGDVQMWWDHYLAGSCGKTGDILVGIDVSTSYLILLDFLAEAFPVFTQKLPCPCGFISRVSVLSSSLPSKWLPRLSEDTGALLLVMLMTIFK